MTFGKTIKEKAIKNYAPVSVVIPCYNNQDTIEAAISSVAQQSWRPKELILIDDGSTDKTLEIIKGLKEKIGSDWIKIIALLKNNGPSIGRNKGWDASTQTYIAFLDADDFWNKDKIKIQLRYMMENNSNLSGHKYLCNGKGVEYDFSSLPSSDIPIREIPKRKWLFCNYYSVPGVIVRRDLPYRFVPLRNYSEDYSLWLRIAFDGFKMILIDLPLSYGQKRYLTERGLSKDLWNMEKAQLQDFVSLFKNKKFGFLTLCAVVCWSLIKYLKRIIMAIIHKINY